jgi:hypothetical protein
LKKNADPAGGLHRVIDCKFEYFSEFAFIFETALEYEAGGIGTCFYEKTRGKISRVSVPLSAMGRGPAIGCALWAVVQSQLLKHRSTQRFLKAFHIL